MTNKHNNILYTGMTNDLKRRGYEHKEKLVNGFTKKYNITKLVYYEIFEDPENAILREKQIKAGLRQKKIDIGGCPRIELLKFRPHHIIPYDGLKHFI